MADNKSLEDLSPEQRDELAALYRDLASNPQTREPLLRITKHIRPGTPMPELEIKDAVALRMKPILDKQADYERKEMEREMRQKLSDKRQALKDKGYEPADVEAIEKLMLDKSIADHMTAAEHYDYQRRAAVPTPSNFQMPRLPLPSKEKLKEAGGFKKHFLQDAHNAVDELRRGQVKIH